jgi:hypothetical protein
VVEDINTAVVYVDSVVVDVDYVVIDAGSLGDFYFEAVDVDSVIV